MLLYLSIFEPVFELNIVRITESNVLIARQLKYFNTLSIYTGIYQLFGHSCNAASSGAEVKMKGYKAIIGWINSKRGPMVIGFDGNHWNTSSK